MNHHFINKLADYDSSGPRPPVPGQEETQKYKVRKMKTRKEIVSKHEILFLTDDGHCAT